MTKRTHHLRTPRPEDIGSKPGDWVWIVAIVCTAGIALYLVGVMM